MSRLPFRKRGRGPSQRASTAAFIAEGLEQRMLLSVQPVGPEVRANTTTAGQQQTLTDHKAVASDAAGNFVVIWESDQLGPNGQLYGQRFNAAGVKQGGEFLITPLTHRGQYFASVAMDASGAFVVAWENRADPFRGIYSRRYSPAGAPQGDPTQVSTEGAMVDVAMDPDGDYVMAWEQATPGDRDIVVQRFDATGLALGGKFFAHSNNSDFQADASVAMNADGGFIVTWVASNNFVARVDGRLFDGAGNPRGGDINLVIPFGAPVRFGQHRVAMDADGDFVVVWDASGWSPDTDGYGVYARRFSPAGTLVGGEFLVNTTTAGTQWQPDVSMDAAGDFAVTWTGDGSSGVTGQDFTSSGARVGGEFRVDTPATRGWFSSVAMDYDGDIAVAWMSSQAGAGDDTYARRFGDPAHSTGTATGQVFQDFNADGARNGPDAGLPNRQVYRDTNNNGQFDSNTLAFPSRAVQTAIRPVSTRRYLGPAAGVGAGWVLTHVNVNINIQYPADGDLTVSLISPAGRRAELFSHVGGNGSNFTSTTLDDNATIAVNASVPPFTGTFRTQNRTLSTFNGESLAPNGYWMMEVQNSGGGQGTVFAWTVLLSFAENNALTDAAGNYGLPVPAGTSTVRQVVPAGWVQTYPAGGAHAVTVAGGQTAPAIDFGNAYAGTVSGSVFNDLNANGINDGGEGLLDGWTVFADLNHNGTPDPVEPQAFSNAFGYSLRGVPLDTPVSLGAIPLPTIGTPWELSAAPGAVTLTAAQPGVAAPPFGAFRRGSIFGTVFDDVDGNGARAGGETGLAGWTVYLDQNNNGQYDGPVATAASTDTPKLIARRILSQLTVAGQAGALRDVDVNIDISYDDVSLLTLELRSPAGRIVRLYTESASGADFSDTTFDDQADFPISDGTAPFQGRFIPETPLDALSGEDPNGVWVLSVSTLGRDPGTLNAWSVTLTTAGEQTTTTNASGAYAFGGLRPGNYTVREQHQPGWTQTTADRVTTLLSAQDAGGFDFGNRADNPAPRVSNVFVRGSAWNPAFMAYLAAQGLGSSAYGFAVGGGAAQLLAVPWLNLNQVSIAFSREVAVDVSDLTIHGVNVANYPASSFAYDGPSRTATWTFAQPLAKDKIVLALDGDAPGGVRTPGATPVMLDGDWAPGQSFPSGNGAAGGDFRFRFNVLPGDVNRSGSVLADDFSAVKLRFFRSTTAPGSGATAYTIFHDLDGSGSIVANDFSAVKARFFNSLPGPEPSALQAGTAAVAAPPRKTLLA